MSNKTNISALPVVELRYLEDRYLFTIETNKKYGKHQTWRQSLFQMTHEKRLFIF